MHVYKDILLWDGYVFARAHARAREASSVAILVQVIEFFAADMSCHDSDLAATVAGSFRPKGKASAA